MELHTNNNLMECLPRELLPIMPLDLRQEMTHCITEIWFWPSLDGLQTCLLDSTVTGNFPAPDIPPISVQVTHPLHFLVSIQRKRMDTKISQRIIVNNRLDPAILWHTSRTNTNVTAELELGLGLLRWLGHFRLVYCSKAPVTICFLTDRSRWDNFPAIKLQHIRTLEHQKCLQQHDLNTPKK